MRFLMKENKLYELSVSIKRNFLKKKDAFQILYNGRWKRYLLRT